MCSFLLLMTQFIYIIIYRYIRKRSRQLVADSCDADESCVIRKEFTYMRFGLALMYAIVCLTLIVLSNNLISSCFIGIVIAFQSFQVKESFPMSGKRPSDINDEVFALYLRGFSQDDYETTIVEYYSSKNDGLFSEKLLSYYVSRYIPIYAIGMTKELGCPIGSIRIYLNDETWQEELKVILEKATLIFIRLHNSESCIWEILNTEGYKNKIFYIAEDESLCEVRKSLNIQQKYGILPIMKGNNFAWSDISKKEVVISTSFSDKEMRFAISKFMWDKLHLKSCLISIRATKYILFIVIFLSLFVTLIFNICYTNLFQDKNNTFALIVSVLEATLLLVVIYCISYYLRYLRLAKLKSKKFIH